MDGWLFAHWLQIMSTVIDYFCLRALLYIFKTEATCMFVAGSLVNQLLPVGKLKLASGSCVPEAKGNAGMQAIGRNK